MELSTSIGISRDLRLLSAAVPSFPIALGLLPDLALERDQEMDRFHVSTDFTGPGITYALAPGSDPLPNGLTLSTAGVLSGTPSEEVARAVVIRGTNAQGSADTAFTVTVYEMLLEFTPTLAGATANATHGLSAETGVALTAGGTDYSGPTPATIAFQWATRESGPIAGASDATYVPNANLFDGETLYCRITPEGYPPRETDELIIRQVPPVAAGALWDEILDLGSGVELYDIAGDFSGAGLVFSVVGPGCTINAASGLLSIDPASPLAGATVTVTALNSGGATQSAFSLTVEDSGVGPGPDIGMPTLDMGANAISFTVDVDCTIWWRRDPTGTNPDAARVIAGGGHDSGSFAVTAGENPVDITLATGNDGLQEISFVAAITPSEPSLVQTVAIEIDTTDPVLSTSVPAAGAGGVNPTTSPTLTFSEPIFAATGTVTIWDVTNGTAHETFDVVADAGSADGQVEIVGATLTIHPTGPLLGQNDYAILLDAGAVVDDAGNPFAGLVTTAALAFSTGLPVVIETDFDGAFPTAAPALWSSIQANPYNTTPEHRGSETWDAWPASVTDGGVVGLKTGSYPQLRFSVPVEVGKSYVVDADFPVGEDTWSGPLRVKIGSAIDQNDYAQIDETQAGQPRVVELRGQAVTATSTELWFAVIIETNSGGDQGGAPAISMLRVTEV